MEIYKTSAHRLSRLPISYTTSPLGMECKIHIEFETTADGPQAHTIQWFVSSSQSMKMQKADMSDLLFMVSFSP